VWSPEPGALNYRIDSDASWMSVDPPTGTSRSETNKHRILFNGLTPGNYLGTLVITPIVDGGLPQSVVVSLRVDEPSLPVRWHTNYDLGATLSGILPTPDGGFLLGLTAQGHPEFGPGFGNDDYVGLRMDSEGRILWTKRFGSAAPDTLRSLQLTTDGGYILAGESFWDASFTNALGNRTSPGFGQWDLWVVRLDAQGNKLWDHSFGGANDESGALVKQTPDGGFVLAGSSRSGPGGNKASPSFGQRDFWVVRLDANGKRLWDKSLGGTGDDALDFLDITADGQTVVGGNSYSSASGNKTNSNIGYWVVRLDTNGNKLGELGLGGYIVKVGVAGDGGFLALRELGTSPSYFLSRFDNAGNLLWDSYLPAFDSRQPGIFTLVDLPDSRVQILASLPWCCPRSLNEALTLDASGQIVRDQVLLQNFYVAAATGRTSDGGWLLCNNQFEIYDLKPAPDARPANQPVLSPLGFRFTCSVETNRQYLTEFSTNLINWVPLQTSRCLGSELEVFDTTATNSSLRFYRTRPAGN